MISLPFYCRYFAGVSIFFKVSVSKKICVFDKNLIFLEEKAVTAINQICMKFLRNMIVYTK